MENLKNAGMKFPANVLLVDVAFLNREAANMRSAMSYGLKRELPLINMFEWISCLALDGKAPAYGPDTQLIFVHESPETRLAVADAPQFLDGDGATIDVPMVNRFHLTTTHPAGMTDTCSLFFDLLYILLDSKDVKNLMVLPSPELYGTSVQDELHKLAAEKGSDYVSKVCLFELSTAAGPEPYRHANAASALAHVFGITPEDLH